MTEESFLKKSLKIAFVVSLYWISSICMVFLNKRLLNSSELKLDAPFFVTFCQCLIAVALCRILGFFAKCIQIDFLPSFKFDKKLSREILPVSICFVSMITFNNLCLRNVGVPFYNVARSLTTLCNVVFSYLILKKTTPPLALACCGGIVFGFLLGVNVEGQLVNLSYTGVAFGALASVFVSLNAIYTAKLLPSIDDDVWKLGYYNNLNSCFLLLPVVLLSNDLNAVSEYPNIGSVYLWIAMVVVGVCGFCTGFVSTWQIKVTTPLTHNISGTAKACAQTVLAVIYYKTPKNALWWLSNWIVLIGSFLYAVVRRNAMKRAHDEQVKNESKAQKQPLQSNA